MKVRVLGAHNCETKKTRCSCILINDKVALDAGGLTSSLTALQIKKLKAVLLTHYHYDHTKDIAALGMNLLLNRWSTDIYSTAVVKQALTTYLMNGDYYPRFLERPPDNPTFRFHEVEPLQSFAVEGLQIMPVKLNHAIPDVGYQVTAAPGKTLFYTGDTGPGLDECWRTISPQLLIIEVTAANRWEEMMVKNGHLTPRLFRQEMLNFRRLKGYLPRMVSIHMNPYGEKEIETELSDIARELQASITLAHEGMLLEL